MGIHSASLGAQGPGLIIFYPHSVPPARRMYRASEDPIKVTLVDLITLLRDLCYYDLYILL